MVRERQQTAGPLRGRSTGPKPHWGFCCSGLTDGRVVKLVLRPRFARSWGAAHGEVEA
jgi:hypothetical protein